MIEQNENSIYVAGSFYLQIYVFHAQLILMFYNFEVHCLATKSTNYSCLNNIVGTAAMLHS